MVCSQKPNQVLQGDEDVLSVSEFHDKYVGTWDHLLDDWINMEDLALAVPLVVSILYDEQLTHLPDEKPYLRQIIHGHSVDQQSPRARSTRRATCRRPSFQTHPLTGNIDLKVLLPKNQQPTHVTPLIDRLSWGLFHERLQVVGAPSKRPTKRELKQRQQDSHAHVCELITRCSVDHPRITFPAGRRCEGDYWDAVCIDGETYNVGDCIAVRAGKWKGREVLEIPDELSDIPEDATPADYFWFAKIVYIHKTSKQLHVQWFEHTSKTYLGRISDLQELFLCRLCGVIDLAELHAVGKVTVHPRRPQGDSSPSEFFCQFTYDESDGSFTDLDNMVTESFPPPNCPICLVSVQNEQETQPSVIGNKLAYLGSSYHVNDYVLVCSHVGDGPGPALIGRISALYPEPNGSPRLGIQLLARMSDIQGSSSRFTDERELFTTDRVVVVRAEDILKRCVVLHPDAIPSSIQRDLHTWLDLSPLHFYVKYHCPSSSPSHDALVKLRRCELLTCATCHEDDLKRLQEHKQFTSRADSPDRCLKAFDPFAGVGAFGLGMEKSGCVKVTHSVEISPSAAATLKKNSPSTEVYNQCANVVLKYAIKTHAKQHEGDPPKDILGKEALPRPPLPGQIDCIIAGFPCQPHSGLNMFQKVHDRKSHLMLTLLAWVDFLRPKYCFFENVRGFLRYNLHASQAGKHKVKGGIDKGGLKFMVHALLSMGYQVRFGLLQAGHYGTPQDRIRFLLIASQSSYPLPLLPQPSHSSLKTHQLRIVLSDEVTIAPILTQGHTAPLKHVTIGEAIEDLLQWDWEDPRLLAKSKPSPRQSRNVLAVECDSSKARYCGPDVSPEDVYSHPPRTSFQQACRRQPTKDIQHFTRTFKPHVVERYAGSPSPSKITLRLISSVVNIPLKRNADYRELDRVLWEWQSAHPLSARAKNGFCPGLYGRVDRDGWFHTTVTNITPTAKQSRVLHDWCLRILSVRELARSQGFPDWFVFVALDDNVTTMHRQIGNAVPVPVGEALGRELRESMLKRWSTKLENAIVITSDSDSE
ncbi:S-adenosyl-L-methionine-dependent methyltransferase [Daedaleopsis nitida]|nr:S-adenosyl-L-methionine-dependent methyltransferase [Daedaleopsis nitida]